MGRVASPSLAAEDHLNASARHVALGVSPLAAWVPSGRVDGPGFTEKESDGQHLTMESRYR